MKNTSRRIRLTAFCSCAILLAGLVSPACFAQGKGGGKKGGGGDDGGGGDPPAVQVTYDLQFFNPPADYGQYGNHAPQQMNLLGELVGWYGTNDGEQPYYLNINAEAPSLINLNDMVFDPQFEVPEGWYIYVATGINNWGDISLALARVDVGSEFLRGAVLELRPDLLDATALPRIHVLPDEAWDRTYPRRINDAGIVLGRGDEVTSYTYQVGLHGEMPDPEGVKLVPGAFDAFRGFMNNETDSQATQIVWNDNAQGLIWRYTLGDESAELLLSGSYNLEGLSDSGQICGTQSIRKNRSIGYRFDGTDLYDLSESSRTFAINANNDVLGWSGNYSLRIHHSTLGVLNLNDYVVARSATEQELWETTPAYFMLMSERNILGTDPSVSEFPAVFGEKNNQLFVLLPVPAN